MMKEKVLQFMGIIDYPENIESEITAMETEKALWRKAIDFIVWTLIYINSATLLIEMILSFFR